jgi:hypothetical protein
VSLDILDNALSILSLENDNSSITLSSNPSKYLQDWKNPFISKRPETSGIL